MKESFVSLIKRHTVKFSMSDLNLASPKTSKSLGHDRFFFHKGNYTQDVCSKLTLSDCHIPPPV